MVVEDDDALRAALARALRLEGYGVDEATDGAQALAHLAMLRADVVVLDVMMPEMDGLTVCQRVTGRLCCCSRRATWWSTGCRASMLEPTTT
jgi:DNA-binding response OmpR family regulator